MLRIHLYYCKSVNKHGLWSFKRINHVSNQWWRVERVVNEPGGSRRSSPAAVGRLCSSSRVLCVNSFSRGRGVGAATGNLVYAAHFSLRQQSFPALVKRWVILGAEILLHASTPPLHTDKLAAVTWPTSADEAFRTSRERWHLEMQQQLVRRLLVKPITGPLNHSCGLKL